MRVVQATEADFDALAPILKKFEQATKYLRIDVAYSIQTYRRLLQNKTGAVFSLEKEGRFVGALGCLKACDLHNGDLTAIETFWFVDPAHRGGGLRLLDAFDCWAKEQGCVKKAMIHLEDSFPEILKGLYERRGYHLVESHYVAEVV